MIVVGVEVDIYGFAVNYALGILAAVVVPPALIACGCEHGIEVGVHAFAYNSAHFRVKVAAGFRFRLVGWF